MENVYVPMTLNEMVDKIKQVIKNEHLTGEEHITYCSYIEEPYNPEFPPNTIRFEVHKVSRDPEDEFGTITLYPTKLTKKVM